MEAWILYNVWSVPYLSSPIYPSPLVQLTADNS